MRLEELEYKLLTTPTADIRGLLANTVYGTKGGLRLKHKDTVWKLDELIDPDFHALYDAGNLVGVVVYSKRRAKFGGSEMNCMYIRYFSVSPDYQGLGVAKYLTEVAVKNYRKTLQEPTVVYAFIEAKNTRSVAVGDYFDPLSLGYFSPIYFSRFFPKKIEFTCNDKKVFHEYYPDKKLLNFEYARPSDKNASYCSLLLDNRYAAVRYYPVSWEVLDYPSNNWLMKKLLPNIPVIRKLVEGKELNFIAVDALSWDSDELLLKVFEQILAENKLNKLFVFADLKDERFKALRDSKSLGFMSKIQKPPRIGIQLFFHDCNDTIKDEIKKYPVEVRGFDVT
ncbi:GNAT family N-acetyltransferase [Parvicella tangerina]|uniref:N-acetyltransferase domain-containing protein n=1 Tax=Parvicella tangerina TaxID=2829795 RepID=A0A916JQ28_9FLAO|nr:GNAT family N-acetyltransferase [Parvicella tangerina]CAG5086350.1 hypothetical protein CRYO30217_03091 [Parvicella tangerina]